MPPCLRSKRISSPQRIFFGELVFSPLAHSFRRRRVKRRLGVSELSLPNRAHGVVLAVVALAPLPSLISVAERGIAFLINSNDELILNVNADAGGADYPDQFLVNNVGKTGSAVVNVGDTISLLDPNYPQLGNIVAVFNVPSQFAVR